MVSEIFSHSTLALNAACVVVFCIYKESVGSGPTCVVRLSPDYSNGVRMVTRLISIFWQLMQHGAGHQFAFYSSDGWDSPSLHMHVLDMCF